MNFNLFGVLYFSFVCIRTVNIKSRFVVPISTIINSMAAIFVG